MGSSVDRLLEQLGGRIAKNTCVEQLKKNRKDFDAAIEVAISDAEPQGWRAAWLLGHVMVDDDPRLRGRIDTIIEAIGEKAGGHQRELLKVVSRMSLDEDREGALFDACMGIWETLGEIPSTRYYALLYILEVVKKYPEMGEELRALTQGQYMAALSAGIRRSLERKISKALEGR